MRHLPFFLCLLLLAGCAAPQRPTAPAAPETVLPATRETDPETTEPTTVPPTTTPPDPIREMLDEMTLEDRVGQLFLARCGSTALENIETYHLGGFVLFGRDFENQDPDGIRMVLSSYQSAAKIPLLLAVDEEGGTVNRISRFPAFRSYPFPSPRNAYSQGGLEYALSIEEEKCQLLASLGLNVNLGPVCDLSDDPSAFLYDRSLGLGARETGEYVARAVSIKNSYRIGSALKHFPGYGNNSDTHTGIAVDERPLEEFIDQDFVPFTAGIQAGAGCILVSHTIVNALDPEAPASLSPAVHRYLRQEMGFDGVILTDDLVMQAITDQYGAEEAAVLAVLAGNDLLCSSEYKTQYQAVLDAVIDGRIDIDTLDSAVRHVLQWKIDLGLIEEAHK